MTFSEVSTKNAPQAIGPYSQAILWENLLFCSGQIPMNPKTGTIESAQVDEQTHRVMKNLQNVLKAANSSFANVLKTTIFLTDLDDFHAVNQVYSKYFSQPYPARACVQVSKLPKNAKIEIEVIAKA